MARQLYLNLYWHMHQPDYRDQVSGCYMLPWTYLHALKDYTDMVHHLEVHPQARVTFNFVPVLIDQLADYSQQFASGKIQDPLLELLLVADNQALTAGQRKLIVDSCFKANYEKLIEPYERYRFLYDLHQFVSRKPNAMQYLSDQYLLDLLVWYHLSWAGESLRRSSFLLKRLMEKSCGFTEEDRKAFFALIGETVSSVLTRYAKLVESGQIEISTTPYHHPILPLLIDFGAARDSWSEVILPEHDHYPGGGARASQHVLDAIARHTQQFGRKPNGMWPAEGGVSHAALMLLAQQNIQWAASGQEVLANSLRMTSRDAHEPCAYLYQPYRVVGEEGKIYCFFRDDNLSDKIGFEYAHWHAVEAVSDFIHGLERIWSATDQHYSPVVNVILDGENAWEYYPYNGYYFLAELYQRLSSHKFIRMTTFSDIVAKLTSQRSVVTDQEASSEEVNDFHLTEFLPPTPMARKVAFPIMVGELDKIVAGSWVYGTFSTWIGDRDKNRGWDMLCAAKTVYDQVIANLLLTGEERSLIERQLAICEASDWFWWFGDYNSEMSVASFDNLFRRNLANLYLLLKQPVPEALQHAVSHGSGDPVAGGVMRRGSEG